MGCIIIAMPKLEDAEKLAGSMRSQGADVRCVCDNGAAVLNAADGADSGVIICGYKLKDMSHMELCDNLPDYFELILVASASKWDMCKEGLLKLDIPFKIGELMRMTELALSQIDARLRKGGRGPGGRSAEQQAMVEKAQRLMMERYGMERVEAYRYIQKQSMNTGNSMVDVAKSILASDYT